MPQKKSLPCLALASSVLAGILVCPSPAGAWPAAGKTIVEKPVSDGLGEGTIVFTEEEDSRPNAWTRRIHAYRFNGSSSLPVTVWQINDGVEDCDAEATARFLDPSPVLTDLNGNGDTEIWTGYIVSCKGDVSPDTLKIIMYEGGRKYAMRGTTQVPTGDGGTMGGEGAFDEAFQKAPKVIRDYARKLWNMWRSPYGTLPTEPPAASGSAPASKRAPVEGEVVKKVSVADSLGRGSIVYSRESRESKLSRSIGLHAYRFSGDIGSSEKVWQINDGVQDCELEADARFMDDSPVITDLDGDGKNEFWTGYRTMCRGDPGPEDLKIIMYEGRTKYAMRGTSRHCEDGSCFGGEGTLDTAFRNGPKAFRSFARELWAKWSR